jgi:hypothetical protein
MLINLHFVYCTLLHQVNCLTTRFCALFYDTHHYPRDDLVDLGGDLVDGLRQSRDIATSNARDRDSTILGSVDGMLSRS